MVSCIIYKNNLIFAIQYYNNTTKEVRKIGNTKFLTYLKRVKP